MKRKFLEDLGLESDVIDKIMDENGADIEKAKGDVKTLRNQLDEAQKTLKSFEGIDISELQSKITELTNEIATNKADFEKQISDRDFNDLVKAIAGEYKARDVKAVMPFLDVETLKASKNQDKDIKVAFDTVKKEQSYLFESDKRVPFVSSSTPGPLNQNNTDPTDKKALANEALRGLFGK
ncbi:MAG: phage scaffolding protein [Eubacterium sp.]